MQAQTAVVLGATGLIGSLLTALLLDDPAFKTVRVLVRSPYGKQHPKLDVQVVNFNDAADFIHKLGTGDCIFCCVGTTQKKVKGDKAAYRKVDYDIPVNAARLASAAGFSKYLLVSAAGADAGSMNFYARLKGEAENGIKAFPFKSIHIFQPSILFGKRNEFRLGELIGKGIMKALSFVFTGWLKKYKGIDAADVAKAMASAAKKEDTGVKVYQYAEIMQLAK
jgi:uncharacterized protein YbjT (DUF2867 family)